MNKACFPRSSILPQLSAFSEIKCVFLDPTTHSIEQASTPLISHDSDKQRDW